MPAVVVIGERQASASSSSSRMPRERPPAGIHTRDIVDASLFRLESPSASGVNLEIDAAG
jgi:hypothetical protein